MTSPTGMPVHTAPEEVLFSASFSKESFSLHHQKYKVRLLPGKAAKSHWSGSAANPGTE